MDSKVKCLSFGVASFFTVFLASLQVPKEYGWLVGISVAVIGMLLCISLVLADAVSELRRLRPKE